MAALYYGILYVAKHPFHDLIIVVLNVVLYR